jgi:hypothetical protein
VYVVADASAMAVLVAGMPVSAATAASIPTTIDGLGTLGRRATTDLAGVAARARR